MILVDTSVWIDFLRKRETLQTDLLKRSLAIARIATSDLVIAEVLQGSRDEQVAGKTQRLLMTTRIVVTSDVATAIESARHYRTLRGLGITVRSTIDTLIATRCILDGIPLLYSDRDYDPFVQHLGLRSALDLPGVS